MISYLATMRALRIAVVVVLASLACLGCGGAASSASGASSTAPQPAGDGADPAPIGGQTPKGKRWAGWRYSGARNACFFVVGRKCFEDQASACAAAACADGKSCVADGAGPATVRCE